MEIIPNFAALEGGDGCGTTTQLSLLEKRLKDIGKPRIFTTFEPTNSEIGKIIRRALKNEQPVQPETLALLFAADRREHLYGKNGILERAKNDEIVVCDRYVLSSLVYQGIVCGDDLPSYLNSPYPFPELTVFLDIEPEIALARMKTRSSLEIFEYRDFQEKVRQKYLSLIQIYKNKGAKIAIIDASKNTEEVEEQLWSVIREMPIFNK
ncbi:MAG: dTMP kinase [Treponema sp.]|nr:dTMP kinase [Treponema sp.]